MQFRIRYKLLIAFAIMLLPLLAIIGITHHTQKVLYRSGQRIRNITDEMNKVHDLQLVFDQVIMPANDYIITGDKLHIADFKRHASSLEIRLRRLEAVLPGIEEEGPFDAAEEENEQQLLKDVNLAWKNIREISLRIFSISNPVGNREAMRLMKDMDYKWAYPIIIKLEQFNEAENREYQEALEMASRAYKRSWLIMIAASLLLTAFAALFAFFYSRIFVSPIITLHKAADAIAGGDFSPRVNIKTNDEVQQLANAMNDMAERLDILYTDMEDEVAERTEELRTAVEGLKEEMAVTSNLLQLAEVIDRTLDTDSLMKHVVKISCRILDNDICLSYMFDIDADILRPGQAAGLEYEMLHTFRTKPLDTNSELGKKAFEARGPVFISGSEIHAGLEFFEWLPGINRIAVIPLIVRKDMLGIIVAIYTRPEAAGMMFTDRLRKVVSGIMYQVSTALEQSRLYRKAVEKAMELSYKIEHIQVMNAMDRAIISSLKPQDILDTAVRLVAKVMSCDMAALSTVDRERRGFVFSGGLGQTFIARDTFIPYEETNAVSVVETGRLQYIANLMELKGPLPFEKRLLDAGMASCMRVPLIVKGEVTGIFSINSTRQAAFTQEDLSVLEKMAAQICVAMENAKLIKGLEELFIGTVKSLSSAIDAKSRWTAGHSERVTNYVLIIGKAMGFSEKELRAIELAGLLHDVGKIGTYESILDKPGKLTGEELEIMKQHPVKGAEILLPIRQLKDILPAIKHHHEFYDGSGYPDGLKGEDIHVFARIMAVADAVDAMAADRPYRKGRSMDDIIAELNSCSGTQFDPYVVNLFLKTLEA